LQSLAGEKGWREALLRVLQGSSFARRRETWQQQCGRSLVGELHAPWLTGSLVRAATDKRACNQNCIQQFNHSCNRNHDRNCKDNCDQKLQPQLQPQPQPAITTTTTTTAATVETTTATSNRN
jgi:hypothetical protein